MREKENKKPSELSINVAFTSFDDDVVMVNIIDAKTENAAKEDFAELSGGEETVLHFISFGVQDIISDDSEIEAGFRIVEALMHHPTTLDVMEQLLATVFEAGQKMALVKKEG